MASWRPIICQDDKYTPTVFANTISMREWIIDTLDNKNNTSVMEDLENLIINDL